MNGDRRPVNGPDATLSPSPGLAGSTANITPMNGAADADVVDVICTTFGGQDAVAAMERAGVIVGQESMNDAPDWATVDFLDFPFTKPGTSRSKFQHHLAVTKEVQPRLVVAPDIEKDLSLKAGLAMADELAKYADTVIVVPKENAHPGDIPDRFRVGFPSQPDFGTGSPWGVWEYADCDEIKEELDE